MNNYSYIGSELELFSTAVNWKAYLRQLIIPYIGSNVLEVGAGIGGTTCALYTPRCHNWLCLEPDISLVDELQGNLRKATLEKCQVRGGTLSDLLPEEKFDTILYIDVLEHIRTDRDELKAAMSHLQWGGQVIVLSPAHQWLFTPFDEAIGHYRRYTRQTLSALTPTGLTLQRMIYLDCVGLLASLANRVFLKSKMPTSSQIKVWDQMMVPVSKRIDPILKYSLGKSILGIWQRKEQ
jgi:cyclopropane fatty-acyl-phospholipid synthase-like methyltransferase